MPDAPPPLCLLWGPPGHGVTDYGADVAAAASRIAPDLPVAVVADLDGALDAVRVAGRRGGAERTHVHVTDRLLGSSPEQAAEALEALAASTSLTVTLHDVPQHSDGTMYARRVAAYGRFTAAAASVVVNSRHERMLVAEHLPGAPEVTVIPLGTRRVEAPVPAPAPVPGDADSDAADLVVLIAGFVYPGKGHAVAIRAAVEAVSRLRDEGAPVGRAVVRALGRASAGHDADVAALAALADARGARFEITGFLEAADFAAELRAPGIPLAAHEHVSASRSMLDWVEAGRCALVVDSRYAREMDELRPGTGILFTGDELPGLLVEAWRRPSRTHLEPGRSLRPTLDDVAEDYLAWWDRVPG